MKKITTIFFAAAAVLSCSKSANLSQVETAKGVVAVAKDFEGATKTAITTGGSFAWAEGDVIGVVPMDAKTFQTNYEVKAVGTDPKSASFDGGAWALKEGKSYAAYYPCQSIVLTSEGTAAVSFTGQEQAANNSTAHLGAYDYMYAQAVSPAAGTATFAFQHQVSLVKVTLPVQADGVYVGLTLSCEDNVFAKNATLSIADGSLAAGDVLSNISLSLNELDLKANDNLEAYLIVLPTTAVNGKALSATLVSSEGTQTSYNITTTVSAFEAGKAYALAGAVDLKVLFSDDFSWLKPIIDKYNAANPTTPIGDFVTGTYADVKARSGANAPNVYTMDPFKSDFPDAFAKAGYTDLNAGGKVIYPQDTYLKFCKTDSQTALRFKPCTSLTGSADIMFSFDFCRMFGGSGNVDDAKLSVAVAGAGTIENGTSKVLGGVTYSVVNNITTEQASGTDAGHDWENKSFKISGATSETTIVLIPTACITGDNINFATKGYNRFFLDNLLVELAE